MGQLVLHTKYPCCGKAGRFTVLSHISMKQAHARVCNPCDMRWDVTIEPMESGRPGVRMDKITWQDMSGREWQLTYGSAR